MLIRRRWPQFLCLLMFLAIEFQACSSIHFQTRLKTIGAFRTRPNSLICLNLRTDANGDDRDDNPQDRKKSQRSNRSNDPNDSDEEDDFELEEEIEKRMRERFQANGSPTGKKRKNKPKTIIKDLNKWEVVNRAVLAGVFVAGIGSGITIDSAINTNPRDLASRDAIDKNAPNPKLCATYGSSAMVLDQRVFITFNPFNVYVTQADTKPGCVLRPSNVVSFLQKERSLITDEEVDGCKNGYNTWAYIGDINNKPQLNCVFQSDDAQNEFLSNPKVGLGEDVYDDDKANKGLINPDSMIKIQK